MKRPIRTCPKCGAALRYEEIMPTGPLFPCPVCHAQLQIPDYYGLSIWAGAIGLPALVFAALGFSWMHLIVAELIVIYPVLYLALRFLKYIIPPKIEIYFPDETTLNLRNGPRS